MNGKKMTQTFFELYTVYIKNYANSSSNLLANLFKQRYISSVNSNNYLNKFIS